MAAALHYVADPMCSWCYGFAPEWAAIQEALARTPEPPRVRLVMGGLAPDSDQPMDDATRAYVQQAWRTVAATTGAEFNHDFWTRCRPRRSTYPACRAVLVAEHLEAGAGPRMFEAIQRAYYREARNPSDPSTLGELARELGLPEEFGARLASVEAERWLQADLALARRLGVSSFPTVVLETAQGPRTLARGYARAKDVLATLAMDHP